MYMPSAITQQEHPAYLRKHLLKRFKNNEFEKLNKELEILHYSKQFMNNFFEKESHSIMNWLLMDSTNNNSFQFILDLFSEEALKNKLRENNFSFLSRFLNSRAGMEELKLITPELKELDKERFKLLLAIDPEGVQDFMNKNKNANFMKPSTWKDYEMVVKSIKQPIVFL